MVFWHVPKGKILSGPLYTRSISDDIYEAAKSLFERFPFAVYPDGWMEEDVNKVDPIMWRLVFFNSTDEGMKCYYLRKNSSGKGDFYELFAYPYNLNIELWVVYANKSAKLRTATSQTRLTNDQLHMMLIILENACPVPVQTQPFGIINPDNEEVGAVFYGNVEEDNGNLDWSVVACWRDGMPIGDLESKLGEGFASLSCFWDLVDSNSVVELFDTIAKTTDTVWYTWNKSNHSCIVVKEPVAGLAAGIYCQTIDGSLPTPNDLIASENSIDLGRKFRI